MYFPSDQRAEILHTSLLVKGGESNAEGSEVWTTRHRSVPAPFSLLTLSAPAHPSCSQNQCHAREMQAGGAACWANTRTVAQLQSGTRKFQPLF